MSEQMKHEVNVEQIMEEIREKIRTEGKYDDIPSFDDIPITVSDSGLRFAERMDSDALLDALDEIKANYRIQYYWEFSGNMLKVLFKRIVRKLIKCVLLPIVDQQSDLNADIACCLHNIRYGLADGEKEQKNLADEIALMKKTIELQQERIDQLERLLGKRD